MRVILIDPFKQEVKEINLNKDNLLQELYDTIGCTTVERVGMQGGIDLIIDEEGLFKSSPAFMMGENMMLHGRAVLVDVDIEEGEWIDSTVSLGLVEKVTMFIPTDLADKAKDATLNGQNVKITNL